MCYNEIFVCWAWFLIGIDLFEGFYPSAEDLFKKHTAFLLIWRPKRNSQPRCFRKLWEKKSPTFSVRSTKKETMLIPLGNMINITYIPNNDRHFDNIYSIMPHSIWNNELACSSEIPSIYRWNPINVFLRRSHRTYITNNTRLKLTNHIHSYHKITFKSAYTFRLLTIQKERCKTQHVSSWCCSMSNRYSWIDVTSKQRPHR